MGFRGERLEVILSANDTAKKNAPVFLKSKKYISAQELLFPNDIKLTRSIFFLPSTHQIFRIVD